MTVLQEFKSMFVEGEYVWTRLPNGMEGKRKVLVVKPTKVGMENLRVDSDSPSWLDWPKAAQIQKYGDRFAVMFTPGSEAWYWKESEQDTMEQEYVEQYGERLPYEPAPDPDIFMHRDQCDCPSCRGEEW